MRPELCILTYLGMLSFCLFGGPGVDVVPSFGPPSAVTAGPLHWIYRCPPALYQVPLPTPFLLQCMKSLFEPFIWSIENNRDGDFSQHLVVV